MPEAFWQRAPLHTAAEVLGRPSPVPAQPGIYGWFFRDIPPGIDVGETFERDGLRLLYVGISPKAPSIRGGPASKQNLYKRIRYHYTGNAEGSTLRLSLGCLLERRLGIELRRVGSGTRMTFSDGEARLREWMETNAVVAVLEHQQPWIAELQIIGRLDLPLNIEHNAHNLQRQFVRDTRAACKARARSLPVLPG